jgi:hypothetical protein
MGIEPTYQAWEARVLPLNYARIGCGRQASARRRFWQSETVESRAGSRAIAQQRRESLVFRLFRIPARLSPCEMILIPLLCHVPKIPITLEG